MSREIKFRAWSNKYKRMFRVSEISMNRDGYTHGLVDAGFENEYGPGPENEEFKSPLAWIGRVDFVKSPTGRVSGISQDPMDEPFYLMRYTGLKDKNGDEIYEGDIVLRNGFEYEIKFEIGSFMLVGDIADEFVNSWNDDVHPLSQLYWENGDDEYWISDLEVIGNKYEGELKGNG